MTENSKSIALRRAVSTDAQAIARIHFAAVHSGTAVDFYPREILFNWSPEPNEIRIERYIRAIESGRELFIVAEIDNSPRGFGSIFPELSELRSLYVDPAFARGGIGSAILCRLEELAVERGVRQLKLDSSLNAEPFYLCHGFESVERGLHKLSGGMVMGCVVMRKPLGPCGDEGD